MAIGGFHFGRRVARSGHRFFDDFTQQIKCFCRGVRLSAVRARFGCEFLRQLGASCQFIEADGYRLAEIHRRLALVGRDLDEKMALGKVVPREASLLGAKDECDPAATFEF